MYNVPLDSPASQHKTLNTAVLAYYAGVMPVHTYVDIDFFSTTTTAVYLQVYYKIV